MKLTLAHEISLPTGALGLAIVPDGSRACVACADGLVYDVEVATGKLRAFEERHQSYAAGCVLLPGGEVAISGGYDGVLLWHEVATGRCLRRVQAHRFWSWQMALSPDGRRVVTSTGQYLPGGWKYEPAGEVESSVKVFDTETGELVQSFGHTPPALSCAFTPDGGYVAAANLMGEVRVWRLGGGGEPVSQWTSPDFTSFGTIKTHHYCGGIYGLAFSPDGQSLLGCGMGPMADPMAGNGRMTWQRWDWRTGKLLGQIRDGQHGSGLMESVCWRGDGGVFVMAGRQAQGTWNAAIFSGVDGELQASIDTRNRITQARFGAGGGVLVLAEAHGQPKRKDGDWPAWGRLQSWVVSE